MDKTILVDKAIKAGENLVKELDKHNYPVESALWFFDSEKKKWVFVISTPELKISGPNKIYSAIQVILNLHSTWEIELRDISLASSDNRLLEVLKLAFRTASNDIAGLRLTGNTIGNVYIEDVYIYRLS